MAVKPEQKKAPINENVPYAEKQSAQALKIRWVHAQCYEIKLPNGKTIVTDPFFPREKPADPSVSQPEPGITADDFEGCDYIVLNHSHGDHTMDIPGLYKKFYPQIICDSRYAFELSRSYDIELGNIYPVESNKSYVFEDFRLDTYTAMHGPTPFTGKTVDEKQPPMKDIDKVGWLFNMNFMFTLNNYFRIGFAAGRDMLNLCEAWRAQGPDLLLRQRFAYVSPEKFAEELMALRCLLTLPSHHEGGYANEISSNMYEYTNEVNRVLSERGCQGRMLNPKRMQWYELSLSLNAV